MGLYEHAEAYALGCKYQVLIDIPNFALCAGPPPSEDPSYSPDCE
jgi:hypothetical protein